MLNAKLKRACEKYKEQAKWPADNDKFHFRVAKRSDYENIYKLFEASFGESRSKEHIEWKYWDHPTATPFAVIALDESEKVIAACTGMKKKAWVNNKVSYGVMLWDICVHPEVRGGGKLFRDITYGMQIAINEEESVNWGFGGQSKPNIIKMGKRWFGYHMILSLKTWELRLNTYPALEKKIGKAAKVLAPLFNTFLKLPAPNNSWNMKHIKRCGEEFNQLWEKERSLYSTVIWRDAQTLNWRYVDNPLFKHSIVGAYNAQEELKGYVIWRTYIEDGKKVSTILDLWHGEDEKLAKDLIATAANSAKKQGSNYIRMALEKNSTTQIAFSNINKSRISPFIEDDNIITSMMLGRDPFQHSQEAYEEMDTVTEGENWFYCQGDVDFRD